ncbi:hypothetical protein VI817_004483 [Penicillium citrinum]|nr:hypothetical protein VI817_004483 [Penicillium citrinum]
MTSLKGVEANYGQTDPHKLCQRPSGSRIGPFSSRRTLIMQCTNLLRNGYLGTCWRDKSLWSDIAAHYSPYPSVIAGPYDRVYTRDMVTNSAVIDYFWWRLYGYGTGPQPNKLESDLLFDVATLIIGTQQVNKTVNCREQYVPAIVPWAGDKNHKPHPYMSFFLLYPTASTINAVVAPSYLEVSYPNTTQTGTDIFTFALAQLPPSWTLIKKKVVKGLEELPSLNVTVNEKGLQRLPVVYGATVKDNRIYNVSYIVPVDFSGTPKISFTFECTC